MVEKHKAAVGRWAAPTSDAFLYPGLALARPSTEALDHAREHAANDLEVVAFCTRGWAINLETLDATLTAAVLRNLLDAIAARGADDGHGDVTLSVGHGIPRRALEFLEAAARARRDFLLLAADGPVPVSVKEVFERSAALAAGDGLYRFEGGLYTRQRLERDHPDAVALDVDSASAEDGPAPSLPPGTRDWFQLNWLRPPAETAAAVTAITRVTRGRPRAALAFVGWLQGLQAPPADESVRQLARCGWPLLLAILQREWFAPLSDAADLVPIAQQIPHGTERVCALAAIGKPAAEALAAEADRALKGMPGHRDRHPLSAGQIADLAPALGIPFWEKRLGTPVAFERLWQSKRLRAAFTLHPEPIYRLIRRAAAKPDKAGRNPGLVMIAVLQSSWETFSLAPVADEVVRLLADHEEGLTWNERFNLLANAGSPEALAELVALSESAQADDLVVEAALFEAAWNAVAPTGRLQPLLLADALLTARFDVCDSAAIAVIEAMLADGLGEPAPGAVEAFGRTPRAGLMFDLLARHGGRLESDARRRFADDLEGFVTPSALAAFRRNERLGTPEQQVPWAELPDDDLGHLVPQVGAWLAARVTWPKLNVPKLLGRAVRAHHRRVLGDHGDAILAAVGDRWPTQGHIAEAARGLSIELDAADLDRCADEGLPVVFRAGIAGLPATIEDEDASPYSDHHWLTRWVFETAWQHAPSLLARHLLPEFEAATDSPWKRGIALGLVALREPLGTAVPDALTAALHTAPEGEAREFYRRQRDTFARESAARQQRIPEHVRTREAWLRIQRAARKQRAADKARPVAPVAGAAANGDLARD